ncbi:MAG: phosphate/phosphite/phosphonate ABC transporter substrate-binding protein [Pseudomonadota bacterium]
MKESCSKRICHLLEIKSSSPCPKHIKRLFLILAAVVLALTQGCSGDQEITLVDFSKTVAVERQETPSPDHNHLRVAVAAMISPKETFVYYRQLLDYIGRNLDQEIQLIQRKTYGEINELLAKGKIDLAFICSGPYVTGKGRDGFELLATPQVQGSHFYRAYLIVNKDGPLHKLEDLRGRVFAFTDPDSNTGKLVPTYWLAQKGERPASFFGKTIYTYSHDNSILAVSRGLVDGASVDGLIWEYYNYKNPTLTSRTRIIKKSQPYGIPPLVASAYLPSKQRERIQDLLFSMHLDPKGQKILEELMISRFETPREEWYEPIRQMKKTLALLDRRSYAPEKP